METAITFQSTKKFEAATLDFESYSECDLKECGAWVYAEHPSTDIICLSYKLPGKSTKLWTPLFSMLWPQGDCPFDWIHPGDDVPQELIDFIVSGGTLEAHNAGFERALWRHVMMPKYNTPACTHWRDTMATCAYRSLPLDLDKASRVLGLANQKDKRGKYLIQRLCKPQKPTKKKAGGRSFDRDLLFEFFQYCIKDTDTEHELGQRLGPLPPDEYRVWVLDQKINDRGVFVDKHVVQAAVKIVEAVEERLQIELLRITGGRVAKASELPALKEWLSDEGYPVADLTADTIDEILTSNKGRPLENKLPDCVKRALEIRQILSKASTKKLYKYLSCAASDGKIHGLLQYHGAGTGRWAGRLLQPQNFPRGDEDILRDGMDTLVEIIASGDPELVELIYGDPLLAIASALRGMIISEEDEEMFVADFSAIEARVTAWVAGETWKIKAFEAFDRGELYEGSADMYCATASMIFGRTITNKKQFPTERQAGKVCVGPDTQVLTDHGIKAIIAVTKRDRVWDGAEWVTHEGLLDQGERETIRLAGVDITPDHEIYISQKISKPAKEVASRESILCQALAHASENLPSSVASEGRQAASGISSYNAHADDRNTTFCSLIWSRVKQLVAVNALLKYLPQVAASYTDTQTSAPIAGIGVASTAVYHPACSDAITRRTNNIGITAAEESKSTPPGVMGWTDEKHLWRIWSHWKDGTTNILISIASTVTKAMNLKICALSRDRKIATTKEKLAISNNELRNSKRVYDLANAGPRHRYTILTDRGFLQPSNCELALGYQGSVGAWRKFDDSDFWTDEQVLEHVRAWRRKHPNIVRFWYNIEDTAIQAVLTGRPQVYRGIQYEIVNDSAGKWLACRLPNGRRLWYYNPHLVDLGEDANGNQKWQLRYEGRNNKKGGAWSIIETYGGMLTENIVQAISRDLMVEGMIRVERAGYAIILTVHDELVAKMKRGIGNLEEFIRLMTIVPDWFKGFPLHADGGVMRRYRK